MTPPDISMCKDEECPRRNECYRFTATPDPRWQCYAGYKWDGDCYYFIECKSKGQRKRLDIQCEGELE